MHVHGQTQAYVILEIQKAYKETKIFNYPNINIL